ncbi:MAG TPA: hypothetical protein PK370_02730 [Candidatus Woesebacteria bacterium]|nr:hypothetical protein [Candidatus Woesebacteria bacterium]HPJ17269.1 hypothetical protein [Candidatus Woesebacteria bacterium]
MKINIIGPSCVGKTTMARMISKNKGWPHFDLDLEFIDRDYLAETKIFRYREKKDYSLRIKKILESKNWIIEGVYAVEEVFKQSDVIIFINLPIWVPLRWQWKRYFTDKSQRDTYGFLNNLGLTKEIISQYWHSYSKKDVEKETVNYTKKYQDMLKKYNKKLKVAFDVESAKKIIETGVFTHI